MGDSAERSPRRGRADVHVQLRRGRACYARHDWTDAFEALARADRALPLGIEDLERLASAAYLAGRDEDYLNALERAHHAYLERDDVLPAVRCAFWLGLRLVFRGELARAGGWFARAQRLLERAPGDCVEQGYLLLPAVHRYQVAGDWAAAYAAAERAAQIGERFREPDLIACARHLQGRVRIRQGQVETGLALLDEVMVALSAGEVSPVVMGMVYCSVIEACQQVWALARAREWTAVLAAWCDAQPQMVAFSGSCRVHRAEIMQWCGEWAEAIEEARRAGERLAVNGDQRAWAAAYYQQGEVHRLRGEFEAAEEAYRSASRCGREPQPGLALLRLAQNRSAAAAATIRRVVNATVDPLERAPLLPAYIEILLAEGDAAEARRACAELGEIVRTFESEVLRAMADYTRGVVALGTGDAGAAVGCLRIAWEAWQRLDAPYLAARARESIGRACRSLGDEDGWRLGLEAARETYEKLGAAPDVARVDSLFENRPRRVGHNLSARELQVLRLIATGKPNKTIAADLCLSEKTVNRHVSNIFDKLDVPSRAAATAYAYEHKLI